MQRFWGGSSALFDNSRKDFDEIIKTPDLEVRLSSLEEPGLGDFVSTHVEQLVRIATQAVSDDMIKSKPDAATLYPKNATCLLGVTPKYAPHLTEAVVRTTMRALTSRTLHHVAAQNIQSIVSDCVSHEPEVARRAAAATAQDAEVFHCFIRHLAAHTVIGDMLLNLLGTDTSASVLQTFDELPHLKWCALGLPTQLAKYAQVALLSNAAPAYFPFLSRLFSQSLSSEIGPFVDDLLELYDGGEDDLTVIVLSAAQQAAEGAGDFPHLVDGLLSVAQLINMVHRVAYDDTQNNGDYRQKLRANKALACVLRRVADIAPLMQSEHLNSEFGRSRGTLGLVRLRIIEIFVALYRLGREESDGVLRQCRFFEHLFALAEQYPEHDILLNIVSEMCCGAANREFDDKALLIHLMEKCDLPRRIQRWRVSKGGGLRTIAHSVARAVSQVKLYRDSAPGVETDRWSDFLDESFAATHLWFESITGLKFSDAGSGGFPPVVHRPTDNPRGEQRQYSSPTVPPPSADFSDFGGFGTGGQSGGDDRSSRYAKWVVDGEDEPSTADGKDTAALDFAAPEFHDAFEHRQIDQADGRPSSRGEAQSSGRPISAGESDSDVVLGDDQWIERTLEDIEDATSPQPKQKPSTFAVVEEWGGERPYAEDPAAAAGGAADDEFPSGDGAATHLDLDIEGVESIPKTVAGNRQSALEHDEDW